ncbi:MAG: transposase [Nocardioidaceae bacterium]
MGRPPSIPVEKKARIVMSVVAGEMTIAEAARRENVSEQSIGRWKADFLEAGKTTLVAGKSGPSTREVQLEAEVADLTQALGEAHVELRVWKKSAEGRLGPSTTSSPARLCTATRTAGCRASPRSRAAPGPRTSRCGSVGC